MDRKIFEIFGPTGWEREIEEYIVKKYKLKKVDYGLIRRKGKDTVFVTGIDEPGFFIVGKEKRGYRIRPEFSGILEDMKNNKFFVENGLLYSDKEMETGTPLRMNFWFHEDEETISGSNTGYRIIAHELLNSELPLILLPQVLMNIIYTLLPVIESGYREIFFIYPEFSLEEDQSPFIVAGAENYVLPQEYRKFKVNKRLLERPIPLLNYHGYMNARIIPIGLPVMGKREGIIKKENLKKLISLLGRFYEEKT